MKKTLLSTFITALFTSSAIATETLPRVPNLPERSQARAQPTSTLGAKPIAKRTFPRVFEPRVPNLPEYIHTWTGSVGDTPPPIAVARIAAPAVAEAPPLGSSPLRSLASAVNEGINRLRRPLVESAVAARVDVAEQRVVALASTKDAEAAALPSPTASASDSLSPKPPVMTIAQATPAAAPLAVPVQQIAQVPAAAPSAPPPTLSPIANEPVLAPPRPTTRRSVAAQTTRPAPTPNTMASTDAANDRPPLITAAAEPVAPRLRAPTPPLLDSTSREAVRQSQDFMTRENAPQLGDDGRVVFTYGAGLPVVVCAPLRVCAVELQPGERVTGALHAGDTVRWHITPAESGSGKNVTTHIIIKPKDVGLETNLLIPTDRRVYYMRLVSRNSEFTARVSFAYPEDVRAAWDAYQQRQTEVQRNVVTDLPPLTADKLFFNYDIEGKEIFRPVRVFDDGQKTYIQLAEGVRHREQPALILMNGDGKEQLVNYRVRNDYYIVDRLFDQAALILGVGREQQKVTIVRRDPQRPTWSTGWFRSPGNRVAEIGESYAQ